MKRVFVNVKLSSLDFLGFRIGGAGLGNILFPWARGVVFARKNNCKKINSTWSTFKLGTYLRKEKDKRTYHNIFSENNIGGFLKGFYLLVGKNINEVDLKNKKLISEIRPQIVNFSGMKNQMVDIIDDYAIVREELYKIVRTKHLRLADKNKPKAIAIHIRLGDFYQPKSEKEIRQGKTNCRLPLKWYITVINKIREVQGENLHVSVFSDGTNQQLKEVLELPNVSRVENGTAISDMLSLSYAKILVASNSTYSLWASYLGRTHTIWFPGTHRVYLFGKSENIFEGELDYDEELPSLFVNGIKTVKL